jgi:hypothetical protein
MEPTGIKPEFDAAAAVLPKTAFAEYLQGLFDDDTVQNVFYAFQEMNLPAPEVQQEFLDATEGGLVFLSRYGVVIRIEAVDDVDSPFTFDRFNDSPWVLQPLATIEAGAATIEICPGVHMEKDDENVYFLEDQLRRQMINFWDPGIRNIGRLPGTNIPVVVDRLAVSRLTMNLAPVRHALKLISHKVIKHHMVVEEISEEARQAAEAQKKLYEPLQKAFSEAWPDQEQPANPRKMKNFWEMCRSYVREGKLVSGWDEIDPMNFREDAMATLVVSHKATAYEARLKSLDPINSVAVAIPQSPRSPA